jgi:hypothetical protein
MQAKEVRPVSREIAIGVAKCAMRKGGGKIRESEIEKKIDETMRTPHYLFLIFLKLKLV